MNYEVAFCLWLLSFDDTIAKTINKYVCSIYLSRIHTGSLNINSVPRKYDVIPVLAKVAKNAVKEKVIRVVVATFRVCSAFHE